MRRFFVLLAVAISSFFLGRLWEIAKRLPETAPSHSPQFLPPVDQALSCGRSCGVERWEIKTLSDAERQNVDLTPIPTTVEALASVPRPRVFAYRRARPTEITTFRVEAYLAGWDYEDDGDIHVILAGLSDQRVTLIAEIPSPDCSGVCASGLGNDFARAGEALRSIVEAPNANDQPIRVSVTGVGFFDRNHGQIGAAPNFIELHPVLALELRR